ncbi:hypothetical protein AYO44_09880 [Planctomycetaceae bacterium SCGC AG-212-F19]|nr:hypothetical protein AYO44_09880 [Planctomycetaceae bacterium SCGC AG-212-F19]
MASDILSDDPNAVVPIYKAFNRDMPEHLDTPDNQLTEALGALDGQIRDLEAKAKGHGAAATVKKAAGYRKEFAELEKTALKELEKNGKKKEPSKQLIKIAEEVADCAERVGAELEVPVREAAVVKALTVLKGRKKPPPPAKVAAFEKELKEIGKEDDPKKSCAKYFQLERSIIKADMQGREEDEPGSTWQDRVEMGLQDAKPLGITGRAAKGLKGLKAAVVSKVTGSSQELMSDEEFLAQKTAFVNSFNQRIDTMAYSVPENSEQEFRGKAADTVKAIADELFDLKRKPADSQVLGKLLMQANTKALQQLTALKRDYPANVTPSVRTHGGKIVVTKAAPKAESLVLQGGGGKGAGYPAMLEEMQKAGMLKDVNLLVGTSIGALNASCLACGGLADERQILDIEIFGQAFDPAGFKKQYPDVTFEHPSPWLENPKKKLLKKVSNALPSCAGEMAKMDQMTAMSVTENLKSVSEQDMNEQLTAKLAKLDDATLARLGLAGATPDVIAQQVKKLAQKVKNQDFKGSDRTSQMITFRDLALLHQLDPVNFKELTITGWEGTGAEGHLVKFSAKEFGDMPVALAARISMGLPVLAPLYWQGRGPFFDGGLGSNAPVEAAPGLDKFYDENDPAAAEELLHGDVPLEVQDAMAKTLLMTFDDGGKAERNLFGEGRNNAAASGAEKAILVKAGVQPEYEQTLTNDATKVYNGGANTLTVYHGDLGTLSLGPLASKEAAEYAENMARMKGLEQLANQADQAVEFTCNNSDEALSAMTTAEKRSFVAAGKPEGGDPVVLELYQKCEQFLAIDDAFQAAKGGGDATGFLDLLVTSPLCGSAAPVISKLRDAYKTHAQGSSSPQALEDAIAVVGKLIDKGCPAFLRPMLKDTVLLGMQQRKRTLAKPASGAAPAFLWQQEFSARAFDNSLRTAAQSNVLLYLKEAQVAYDALKTFEKLNAELGTKDKPKDVCEAARKALTALEGFLLKLRIMARVPLYTAMATLLAYVQWLEAQSTGDVERLRSVAKGKNSTYPAHTFVAWDRKDCAKKKEEAINNGVVEDPGSHLEAQMEEAVKASASWNGAEAEAKEKAAKAAWKAWDKFIRLAKALQAMTENQNFSNYLEDAVTKATQERAKFGQL